MEALLAIALIVPTPVLPAPPAIDTLVQQMYVVGAFHSATRLALSPQGWLYVVEAESHRVHLITAPESKQISIGGFGWGPTSFDHPTAISTDGLNVYVADYNNHRIQRFDRKLNYLSTFSTRDTNVARVRFGFPTGVALSRFGDLFLLDAENVRVLKFNQQLQLERTFGSIEAKEGRLQQPLKILLSPDDRVYVLEPHRLVVFDYFGNFIRTVGERIIRQAHGFDVGSDGLVVATEDSLLWFSPDGRMKTAIAASAIVAEVPLIPLRDVVLSPLHRDRLFLLTPQQVVVLKLVVP
jgi:hypothetical protein